MATTSDDILRFSSLESYDELIKGYIKDSTSQDFGVYCEDSNKVYLDRVSLWEMPSVGDLYNEETITEIDTTLARTSGTDSLFDSHASTITTVEQFGEISPTSMLFWFYNYSALTSCTISSIGDRCTTMRAAFRGCTSLPSIDLSGWNTAKVKNMADLFYGCAALESIDVSGFNTAKVTNMSDMFYGCTSLTSLDISSFDCSNVTTLQYTFYKCEKLGSLDFTGMSFPSLYIATGMFEYCYELSSITFGEAFKEAPIGSASSLFYYCGNLTSIDMTNFNLSGVSTFSGMFYYCTGLTSVDFTGVDTSSCNSYSSMFNNCTSLPTVDLSSFTSSIVKKWDKMFRNCTSLESVTGLSDFDFSKATTTASMFYNCAKLSGSMTIRGTTCTTYTDMFAGCSTEEGTEFVVNYDADAADIAAAMVATKSENSNVILGSLVE